MLTRLQQIKQIWGEGGNIWHLNTPDAPSWQVTLNKTTALFWNWTQRRMLIPYRRFGTTYRSHLQGSRISRRKPLFLDFLQRRYGITSLRYIKSQKSAGLPYIAAEAYSHASKSFNWMRLFALCRFLLPLFYVRIFSSTPFSQTLQIHTFPWVSQL